MAKLAVRTVASPPGRAGDAPRGEARGTDPDTAELAMRLRLAMTRLRRRLRQESAIGLSQTDMSALAMVLREGPIGLGELAQAEGVRPPSMTRIASGLERQGLVSRHVDPADRRRASLQVTTSGRQLVERNRRRKNAYLARRLNGLSAADLVTLDASIAILERLVEPA
ncbi:MAG: MarR family transcriptional regulator [Candidatus Dormiibacterota bacterium]